MNPGLGDTVPLPSVCVFTPTLLCVVSFCPPRGDHCLEEDAWPRARYVSTLHLALFRLRSCDRQQDPAGWTSALS